MQMAKRLCLDPAAVASSGACSSSGAASFSAPPSSSGAAPFSAPPSSSGAASFSAPPSSSGASCSIDKHAIGYKSLWEADYPWLSEGDVVGMLPHPLTRYFNFLGETLFW